MLYPEGPLQHPSWLIIERLSTLKTALPLRIHFDRACRGLSNGRLDGQGFKLLMRYGYL